MFSKRSGIFFTAQLCTVVITEHPVEAASINCAASLERDSDKISHLVFCLNAALIASVGVNVSSNLISVQSKSGLNAFALNS